MDQERIYILIQKYRDNTASEAEKEELLKWYRLTAYQDAEFPESEDAAGDFMLSRLHREINATAGSTHYKKWLAAAAVLLIGGASWLFVSKFSGGADKTSIASIQKNDIAPGGNKAILTLADGSKISLTDAGKGKIASQSGIQITKSANGELIYTIKVSGSTNAIPATPGLNQPIAFNTIETPKGGQFQVTLPDGSKVWLNALSSIKFPVNFNAAKERRVELKGEAYFEVVHKAMLPFRVVSDKQVVEDIGTHFNVNAYGDESNIKTSLLQGKVRITTEGKTAVLIPGQQATIANGIKVTEVNTDEVIAWKNGYFNFDDEKLENIMKSVARWYNVDVVFEDESLKRETFGAITTRFANISTLLKIMEQTGDARFSIEGSTIKISRRKSHQSL
ncbi:FecR family protein [Mucilaginibacter gotjawali]|uniref:Ferric-dicitrate binding protein FerR (Iron transport regulator) n=2 Tax=Mucilaginibacter gotjawali TaxID=1550579 RepID=A0A839SA32_9SPHI|nr:FecR domain-containing protein [Mucilaginibacter gotjawali]MBB3053830.1 ferric-dicitrate binding protein FerR (iron transport regulator) [Mucilaginibacter gotjawali]BAU54093.1 fec operon regulator FecR [Mucilaginibacter gotjawali]